MLTRNHYLKTRSGTSAPPCLRFRKGEIVYGQGEPATHWYKIISGTVRTCFFYANGHRQLTGFFYPGDVLGLEQSSYAATAEAVTDAVIESHRKNEGETAALYKEGLDTEVLQPPLQRALDSARNCIYLLGHRTAAERLAAFLIMTAQRLGMYRLIHLPMSRSDIGDHLGLTIHTVSRTFSEFSRQGLIAFDGPQDIKVMNWDGLSEISGEGYLPLDMAGAVRVSGGHAPAF